jgi:hypothetical protein
MAVTLALLEDELTLYCIDGGLAVSADFHIGEGSQTQGHDPDLGREGLLMVCDQRVLFVVQGFNFIEEKCI